MQNHVLWAWILIFQGNIMAAIPKLDFSVIESIPQLLGSTNEGFTGTKIAKFLSESKIERY